MKRGREGREAENEVREGREQERKGRRDGW